MSGRKIPQQERSRVRYERILDSAMQLVVESGSSQLSTNDIAERAEVAIGSIYQFFENVEDIKRAIIERFLDKQVQGLEALFAQDSILHPDILIERIINYLCRFYSEHKRDDEFMMIMRKSELYLDCNEEVNQRVFELGMSYLTSNYRVLDELALSRRLKMIIAMSDGIILLMASARDTQEYQAYIAEWKLVFRAYSLSALLVQKTSAQRND